MPYEYMIEAAQMGPAHQSMIDYARELVRKKPPQEVAAAAGVRFDAAAQAFSFDSLGQRIEVALPECSVLFSGTDKQPQPFWLMSILHYLDMADGAPLSGDFITLRMLEGGMVRGGNFDRDCARILGRDLSYKPVENVVKACEALGGRMEESNADICAVFPYLPRYPVMFKLWMADDEICGSGQLLVSASADHYLSMEDAVTSCSMILDFILLQYNKMFPAA